MIRKRFFSFLASCATTRRGVWVLALAAFVTVGSLALLPQLKILTSREGMVSEDLPVQKRYLEYNAEFGTPNQLIVLLEGAPDKLHGAAEAVAGALRKNPEWVKNVFYKIDLASMRKAGLYYLSDKELLALESGLAQNQDKVAEMLADGSWTGLLGRMESETGSVSLDSLKDEKKVNDAFTAVDRLLAQWLEYLETPDTAKMTVGEKIIGEMAADRQSGVDQDGYLIGAGGRMTVLFVQQSKSLDDTEFTLPFMKSCRETVASTLKDFDGVTAGFTGWPVSIEEEIYLIRSDLKMVSMVSGIIILGIFLLAFRSIHKTILVFVPLLLGVLWNFGLTVFTVGHLNYLTSVFVGILFGLGIDYGVVFIRRFDEERAAGCSPNEAITNTLTSVGPSVTTGAGTVIAAFLAIGFTDQPAFSELGIVAGTGVLCVLISTLFVFPVLIARFPPKFDPTVAKKRAESKLLKTASTKLLRFPVTIAVVLCAAAVGLATQIPKVGFDYDLNNLLPKDSETVRVAAALEENTPYKQQYITVITDTLEQTQQLAPLYEALPTVARVESVAMLVPTGQKQKQARFQSLRKVIEAIAVGTPSPPDLAALNARIDSLVTRVEDAQEDAFSSGQKNLVKHLESVLGRFDDIQSALKKPDAGKSQALFEAALFDEIKKGKNMFLNMLDASPITLATLSPTLRDRFVSSKGRFATYLFPTEKIWDVDFLDRFLGEVEQTTAKVFPPEEAITRLSGFGVVFRTTSRQIHEGFYQASWTAALIVFLMLFLDFRKPRFVLLAALPLFFGVAITMGGMGLLGVNLNMASQISFPILLGIGVDYGILFTRRWLEKDGADLPRVAGTIGYSISLAAATTMAGFGSLLFAQHRGLISFGSVLVVAVFICLASTLIGLPAIIRSFKMKNEN
jgi:hypothetical protein